MHFSSPISLLSVMIAAASAKEWTTSSVPPSYPVSPSSYPAPPSSYPAPSSSGWPAPPSSYPVSPSSYPAPSSSGWPAPPSSYPGPSLSSWASYPPPSSTPVGPASISTSPPPYPIPTSSGWSTSAGPISTGGAYPHHGTGVLTTSTTTRGYPAASSSFVPPVNAGVSQYSAPMMGLGLVLAAGALMAM